MACNATRRPSLPIFRSHGLWSLWDMLNHWGYKYYVVGTALAYTELDLINHRRQNQGVSTGKDITIDPNGPAAKFLDEKCHEILKFADDQDLSPIPQNIRRLVVKIVAAKARDAANLLYVDDVLQDITRLNNDFRSILAGRYFYSISPELKASYGQPELFGPLVAKKFKAARDDIEHAGNCLALGESTACVLHLLRAMETALRQLSRTLHVAINPKDTWGMILKNMDHGIQALPEKTEQQKRKKSKWAECRANLFHVKLAWRDDSMHGKVTYDPKQARDILERVRAFMQHLATL